MSYELTRDEGRLVRLSVGKGRGGWITDGDLAEAFTRAARTKLLRHLWELCTDPLHDGYANPRHECRACMDAIFKFHEEEDR